MRWRDRFSVNWKKLLGQTRRRSPFGGMPDWRGLFVENWPYKLAALALALLLWFNVTAEQRQDYPVPTRLQVEVQDTSWVVVEAPEEVTTTFQGRRSDALALSLSRNPPAIRHVIDTVTADTMSVELSPERVSFDRNLNVRPVTVRPQRVGVAVDRRISRRVPVVPDLDVTAAANFAVVRPFILQPDSVTVRGAEGSVSTLTEVTTEPVQVEELQRDMQRQLQVRPPAGVGNVEVDPPFVQVVVEVDTLVERTLRRPLERRSPETRRLSLERDSVAVTLRGPRSQVEALSPPQISAYLEADSLTEDATSLPVKVQVPAGAQVTAVPDPDRVPIGSGAATRR